MTKPPFVQTSTVVKSIAAKASQWALRNVAHVVCRFRSGAGWIPCCLRTLPMVASEIGNRICQGFQTQFMRGPMVSSKDFTMLSGLTRVKDGHWHRKRFPTRRNSLGDRLLRFG